MENSLEDCGLSISVAQTFENKTTEQKGGFLGMLLATLGAGELGNMLAGKDATKLAKD